MKKIMFISLLLFCFLGTAFKSHACSPIHMPFMELLNEYKAAEYIILEGYFQIDSNNKTESKFKVTRTSDSLIIIGKEYEVFEYGPFGSTCEMYEMRANIETGLMNEKSTRLLIVYKKRCSSGKLVTPIFWGSGEDVSKDKIVSYQYENATNQYISYESAASLDEIWKQILADNTKVLKWKKQAKKN